MIIDDEVRAALDTLRRHAAGNDFELHRIDVLEKDFVNPPKAEIIDEQHQKFLGFKFRKKKNGGHYVYHLGIHQAVWLYYHGEIPYQSSNCHNNDYGVHHRNEDKSDNDISNLQLLTREQHTLLHTRKMSSSRKRLIRKCDICGKEYETLNVGRNRFCSPECREKGKVRRRRG